jgi:hypothetical protein
MNYESSTANTTVLRHVFNQYAIAYKIILISIFVALVWSFITFLVISETHRMKTIRLMTSLSTIIGLLLFILNVYAVYKLYINSKKASETI